MKTKIYTSPFMTVEQIVSKSLMNPASPDIIQNGGTISDLEGEWDVS